MRMIAGAQPNFMKIAPIGFLLNPREAVIDVLEDRFGVTPKSVVNKINKIDKTSVLLKMLLKKAGIAASLTEFKDVI